MKWDVISEALEASSSLFAVLGSLGALLASAWGFHNRLRRRPNISANFELPGLVRPDDSTFRSSGGRLSEPFEHPRMTIRNNGKRHIRSVRVQSPDNYRLAGDSSLMPSGETLEIEHAGDNREVSLLGAFRVTELRIHVSDDANRRWDVYFKPDTHPSGREWEDTDGPAYVPRGKAKKIKKRKGPR